MYSVNKEKFHKNVILLHKNAKSCLSLWANENDSKLQDHAEKQDNLHDLGRL